MYNLQKECKMKRLIGISLLIMVSCSFLAAAKLKIKDLPPRYKKWISEDVVYIISEREKDSFLQLANDRERDIFIKAFWNQRDPNPNTPENEFKAEHYKRIAYANNWFGKEGPGAGWRSDQGQIYIILGEPNHIERVINTTGVRPTIIWFYSARPEMGLPQGFNVVFFKEGGIGEYKLYSPVRYGPQFLMEHYMGDMALNHYEAFRELMELEPAVAMISLTLFPSESSTVVSPSIASELLIKSKIPAAPTRKIDTSYAEKILKFKGQVSVDHLVNFVASTGMVRIIRDKSGIDFVHYLIEPARLSMEQYDENIYSNLEINGRITDLKNNTVYQFTKEVPIKLTVEQVKKIQKKLFSFQDMFPLVPGNYKYSFLIVNSVGREFTSIEGDLILPERSGFQMSPLVLANSAREDIRYSGRFKPYYVDPVQYVPSPRNDFNADDSLHVYFQLYNMSDDIKENGVVEYKITNERSGEVVISKKKNISDYRDDLNFYDDLSLKGLSFAYYTITVGILDGNRKKVLEEQGDFFISPLRLSRPWVLSLPYSEKSYAIQYHIMGQQYMNKGDKQKALEYLKRAHVEKPLEAQFAQDYATMLLEMNELDQVFSVIRPFLDTPNRNMFMFHAGFVNFNKKNYEGAVPFFKEYLTSVGMNVKVVNALADCFVQLGENGEALKLYQLSLDEISDQPEIKEKAARLKGEQNEKTTGKKK